MKRSYTSPTIKVETVQIEHSIAAGSAQVVLMNNSNEVEHIWENNISDDREIYW